MGLDRSERSRARRRRTVGVRVGKENGVDLAKPKLRKELESGGEEALATVDEDRPGETALRSANVQGQPAQRR